MPSSIKMGLTQADEDLNRTKSLDKKELLFLKDFKLRHSIFSAFGLELKQKLLPSLKLLNLQTTTTSLIFLFFGPLDSGQNSIKRKVYLRVKLVKQEIGFIIVQNHD